MVGIILVEKASQFLFFVGGESIQLSQISEEKVFIAVENTSCRMHLATCGRDILGKSSLAKRGMFRLTEDGFCRGS